MFTDIEKKKFEELTDVDLDYLYNEYKYELNGETFKGLLASQIADMYGVSKDKVRRAFTKFNIRKKTWQKDTITSLACCLVRSIELLKEAGMSEEAISAAIGLDEVPDFLRDVLKTGRMNGVQI